jgi:hypothetical protein
MGGQYCPYCDVSYCQIDHEADRADDRCVSCHGTLSDEEGPYCRRCERAASREHA